MQKIALSLLLVVLITAPSFAQEITKGKALKVQLEIIAKGSEKTWKNCLINEFRKLKYVKLVNKDPDYKISVFSILITKLPSKEPIGYSAYSSVLKPIPEKYLLDIISDEYHKKVKKMLFNGYQIMSQKIVFNLPEHLDDMCRDISAQFKEAIFKPRSKKKRVKPEPSHFYTN